MSYLPATGLETRGLVVGDATHDSQVTAAASESDSLVKRLYKLRTSFADLEAHNRFDIVASHFALYSLPVVDQLTNKPFIYHFHGPWALETREEGAGVVGTWVRMRMERYVYRRCDRFIVLSETFQRVLSQNYGVPESQIRIVPGGVDIERFNVSQTVAQARQKMGWPQDRPVILSVRRLVHRVGLENLIRAMQHVIHHVPDACLLIAGKGPLAPKLKAQIRDLDLDENVRLLGFVPDDDLPLAYRAANISIVPTQALEGFGLVAVESLAAGTPVLVTPVGGLPEVVDGLSSDCIIPATTVDAIGAHLVAALRGSLTLPSADSCRNFVTSRYDWSIIAKQVREVYEEVL
jgi:glycosyltransferase involved in cell wall biosynthesis